MIFGLRISLNADTEYKVHRKKNVNANVRINLGCANHPDCQNCIGPDGVML